MKNQEFLLYNYSNVHILTQNYKFMLKIINLLTQFDISSVFEFPSETFLLEVHDCLNAESEQKPVSRSSIYVNVLHDQHFSVSETLPSVLRVQNENSPAAADFSFS